MHYYSIAVLTLTVIFGQSTAFRKSVNPKAKNNHSQKGTAIAYIPFVCTIEVKVSEKEDLVMGKKKRGRQHQVIDGLSAQDGMQIHTTIQMAEIGSSRARLAAHTQLKRCLRCSQPTLSSSFPSRAAALRNSASIRINPECLSSSSHRPSVLLEDPSSRLTTCFRH